MSSVSDTGPEGAWRRRGGCGRMGWAPVEILAVVLGFMVYWPIGLGLIAWKMIQRRSGVSADWFGDMRAKMEGFGRTAAAGARPEWAGFGFGQTQHSGNAAFDDWRKQEIERLEVERRKLEEAQREFAAFVEEARKAQDREAFERFMQNRGRPQA